MSDDPRFNRDRIIRHASLGALIDEAHMLQGRIVATRVRTKLFGEDTIVHDSFLRRLHRDDLLIDACNLNESVVQSAQERLKILIPIIRSLQREIAEANVASNEAFTRGIAGRITRGPPPNTGSGVIPPGRTSTREQQLAERVADDTHHAAVMKAGRAAVGDKPNRDKVQSGGILPPGGMAAITRDRRTGGKL